MNYLSKDGYEALDLELRELKTKGRKDIANEIAEARAQGDLSENAEYDAAKEAQGHLEKRIAELEHVLATSKILDEKNIDTSKAHIFTKVTILNKKVNKEMQYILVSPAEADFKLNRISIDSPIGQALLGRSVGETVVVNVPAGKIELEIKNIEL